jgi:hypothetical protein
VQRRGRPAFTTSAVRLTGYASDSISHDDVLSGAIDDGEHLRAFLLRYLEFVELACSALVMERDPPPDPAGWDGDDPLDRLREGLDELYGYYARIEGLAANILRDSDRVPTTHEMMELRFNPASSGSVTNSSSPSMPPSRGDATDRDSRAGG